MSTSNESDLTYFPEGTEPLHQQVAGHKHGGRQKLGLLRHTASGDILKPINNVRSEREWKFYESIFSDEKDTIDACLLGLRPLVPQYNGLFEDTKMNVKYIRLADATMELQNASVLDMKIGQITYDHEATATKIKSEEGKYKYAKALGFRILGERVFDRTTRQYIIRDKHYGTSITPDNVTEALLDFVQSDRCLVAQFRRQLAAIRTWFLTANRSRWKFISSSLFFGYGQLDAPEEVAAAQEDDHQHGDACHRPAAFIKMIDFAHVFENQRKNPEEEEVAEHQDPAVDSNYLYGIDKLDYHFQMVAKKLQM